MEKLNRIMWAIVNTDGDSGLPYVAMPLRDTKAEAEKLAEACYSALYRQMGYRVARVRVVEEEG